MHVVRSSLLLALAVGVAACGDTPAEVSNQVETAAQAKKTAPLTGTPQERAAAIAANVNARLEAAGSEMRLDEAWFFTVGRGTDPFRRLRTGSRWTDPGTVTYQVDLSDLTTDVPPADAEAAIVGGFESWNAIPKTSLRATRIADDGGNNDILDGIIRNNAGVCIDVVDVSSPRVTFYNPNTGALSFSPVAHDVFGGWLDPEYFVDCLGSANIIGVTWSFSFPDGFLTGELDGYADRAYTEQFYNSGFTWTTTDATFLGDLMDIESIVVHETGHTHGLGHFGGPNTNQPFKLQPNGRVFDPEAVMNPFYLGGEKREPLQTDVAGLRTLYIGN